MRNSDGGVAKDLAEWVAATDRLAQQIAQAAREENRERVDDLVESLMRSAVTWRLEKSRLDPDDPWSVPLSELAFDSRFVAMVEEQLGVVTLGELLQRHAWEIAAMKNVGQRTVDQVLKIAAEEKNRLTEGASPSAHQVALPAPCGRR